MAQWKIAKPSEREDEMPLGKALVAPVNQAPGPCADCGKGTVYAHRYELGGRLLCANHQYRRRQGL